MKAIVVDDSRAVRSILRTSLKRKGFEVVEAGDGKQALDYLQANGPLDLALIDWNMPVMTGYELICALRGDTTMDSMPIMMVTTETEMVQVQKALLAGANEYVMKPFTEDAFSEKLLLLGFGGE
jgi:two-component system chemotaxis response regulator CheY